MRIPRECCAHARHARRARRGAAARVIALASFVGLALVGLSTSGDARAGARPGASPSAGLAVASGNPAPDFAYDTGAGEHKLSESRGAPALIHFWDSWCGPCIDELPLVVRAHKEDPEMTIITVSDEDPGVARKYLKEQGLELPVTEDTEHKVFRLYGVHAIPATVFVRPDGKIGYVSVGEMDWPEFSGALAALRRP